MRKHPLVVVLLILTLSFVLLEATKTRVQAPDYEDKLHAAELTAACHREVHQLKLDRGIPMDANNDINGTGLIGQDYSTITTTLGNLEAKRTSTNPNMAAVVVDMFHELGLKAGDKVAINCSGSFPGLNIAVMCAVQTLGLDAVQISSFGSSTHGANDPELTFLDMEDHLYEKGLLHRRSNWFSIGGMEDMGKEMPKEVRDQIVQRIRGLGYDYFEDDDLLHNVEVRYQMYRDYGDIKCFVNVGGNDAAFGDSSVMVHTDGGVLTELSKKDRSIGLVQLFLKDGTPVIHLLNIKSLATEYGLPIDPIPLPEVGEGQVYYEYTYQVGFAWAGLGFSALVLILGRHELKLRPKRR